MKIITLCGSSKFKKTFYKVAYDLTISGHVVLMPHVFEHADNLFLTNETKRDLDTLHKAKILISNEIFIINPQGYIGNSTQSEIDFALSLNKTIKYYK